MQTRPEMEKIVMEKILCCILNHNENAKAIRWWEGLSPHFDTLILDSGSTPPCTHEGALVLDNIYYSGLMNQAYELLKQRGYRWLMIVTSDIEIDDRNLSRLVERMQQVTGTENVGLYQPSCALSRRGRALYQSLCHYTGRLRRVNFQEGWFHMVCRELLDEVLPVDLTLNRLGWGIDLALCHFARLHRMLVLVDDRVRVIHPKGRGYSKSEAREQMLRWHASIPGYESPRHFRPLKDEIRYR